MVQNNVARAAAMVAAVALLEGGPLKTFVPAMIILEIEIRAPATWAVLFTSGESARWVFSSGGTYDSGDAFVPGISLGFPPFRNA
jgi:hypothetical protein